MPGPKNPKAPTVRGTSPGNIYAMRDPLGDQRKQIDPIIEAILGKVKNPAGIINDCQFLFRTHGRKYSLTCMEQKGIEIETDGYILNISLSRTERKLTVTKKDFRKSHGVKFGSVDSAEVVDDIEGIFTEKLLKSLEPQPLIDLKIWDGGFAHFFNDPWKKAQDL